MNEFKEGDTVYHWHSMDLQSSIFIAKVMAWAKNPHAMVERISSVKFLVQLDRLFPTKQSAIEAMERKLREITREWLHGIIDRVTNEVYKSIPKRPCEDFYPDW